MRLHQRLAISFLDERALARIPDAVGNHVHRRLEVERLPTSSSTVARYFTRRLPTRVREQLEAVRAFRAEPSSRDGRFRVAFDRDELAVAVVNELAASDGAVRTDRAREWRAVILRGQRTSPGTSGLEPGAIAAVEDLLCQRPPVEQFA